MDSFVSASFTKSYAYLIGVLGLILLVVVACGPTESEGNLPTVQSLGTLDPTSTLAAYPVATLVIDPYPAPQNNAPSATESSYPAPAVEEPRSDPSDRFQIDLPLAANSTNISGQAPPSLPLSIVDVTFAGVILGSGQSDENGRFEIAVEPLPGGHRIGIALAYLDPGVDYRDKIAELYPYRGDGYMMLPDIGVFFETALTEE